MAPASPAAAKHITFEDQLDGHSSASDEDRKAVEVGQVADSGAPLARWLTMAGHI